jgi:flagellar hook-basal body complex protein FliE
MIDAVNMKAPGVGAVKPAPITGAQPVGGGLLPADFSEVLSNLAANAATTLKTGEAMSLAGMQGKIPTQQVVGAVMEAEQTLQTAIALRDKAVAAYLELSRLAI